MEGEDSASDDAEKALASDPPTGTLTAFEDAIPTADQLLQASVGSVVPAPGIRADRRRTDEIRLGSEAGLRDLGHLVEQLAIALGQRFGDGLVIHARTVNSGGRRRNRPVVLGESVAAVPSRSDREALERPACGPPRLGYRVDPRASGTVSERRSQGHQRVPRALGDASDGPVGLVGNPAAKPETQREVANEHPKADALDAAADGRVELNM